jgi:hypothetical protein
MRWLAVLAALAVASGAVPAAADSKAEAGEAARGASCTPTKTEVIRYKVGERGETIYKISCAEDKKVFVEVVCRGRTCVVMRPPNEFSIH